MKKILLCIALILNIALHALQANGDTIETAIEINGIGNNTNSAVFNSATDSGMLPACISSEDVYYKHTTDIGDNSMLIGMTSAGTTAFADISYQIFVAPNNDMESLQELDCDSYEVVFLVGGSFVYEVEDINEQNTYFLRVYKADNVGGTGQDLTTIMDNSVITMDSQFDQTLSNNDFDQDNFKMIIKDNTIDLVNNRDYKSFKIYGLDGKVIQSQNGNLNLETINTTYLDRGLYVINLESDSRSYVKKFVKN